MIFDLHRYPVLVLTVASGEAERNDLLVLLNEYKSKAMDKTTWEKLESKSKGPIDKWELKDYLVQNDQQKDENFRGIGEYLADNLSNIELFSHLFEYTEYINGTIKIKKIEEMKILTRFIEYMVSINKSCLEIQSLSKFAPNFINNKAITSLTQYIPEAHWLFCRDKNIFKILSYFSHKTMHQELYNAIIQITWYTMIPFLAELYNCIIILLILIVSQEAHIEEFNFHIVTPFMMNIACIFVFL